MRRFARWQRAAIERLGPAPGGTVLDVACGTGINLELLRSKVGPEGRVVGIELSPDMIAQARERVAVSGWDNVTLLESAVEDAEFDASAGWALFSFTHDVLQSPSAVANVMAHLEPGARVASVGGKLAGGWSPLVNFVVRRQARAYMTTFRGLARPWRELERYCTDIETKSLALGGAYIAVGTVSADGVRLAQARD
jgi:demethylmenaquinone methyltransferase/2-methoxy-6-polyprenyl-1,4-benzoquinol methylase